MVILHHHVLQVGKVESREILDHVAEECGTGVEINIEQEFVEELRKFKYLVGQVALVVKVEAAEQVDKVDEVETVEEEEKVVVADEVDMVELVETVEMEKAGVCHIIRHKRGKMVEKLEKGKMVEMVDLGKLVDQVVLVAEEAVVVMVNMVDKLNFALVDGLAVPRMESKVNGVKQVSRD